jgi:hypothetical protein
MSPFKKHLFRLSNSILNCFLRILRKVIVSHNQLMQLIPKKVSACSSSMSIIYCKETASRPLINLFKLWFNNIEYYAYSILIIVSNNALMGVGSIAAHHTIFFAGEFGGMVTLDVSLDLLMLHLDVFLLLLHRHNKASIRYQLILTFT